MTKCTQVSGKIEATDIAPSKNTLDTKAVCATHISFYSFVRIGKKSNIPERNQAMVLTQQYIDR